MPAAAARIQALAPLRPHAAPPRPTAALATQQTAAHAVRSKHPAATLPRSGTPAGGHRQRPAACPAARVADSSRANAAAGGPLRPPGCAADGDDVSRAGSSPARAPSSPPAPGAAPALASPPAPPARPHDSRPLQPTSPSRPARAPRCLPRRCLGRLLAPWAACADAGGWQTGPLQGRACAKAVLHPSLALAGQQPGRAAERDRILHAPLAVSTGSQALSASPVQLVLEAGQEAARREGHADAHSRHAHRQERCEGEGTRGKGRADGL
jgi:hypothetical protein